MMRWAKFVGLLASIAVLAMPAAALVSCWAPMMSPACPMCPGLTHGAAPATVQLPPAGVSCCDVSSAKPAPASTLQAPISATTLAPPAAATAAVDVSAPARFVASTQEFAWPPASPQAILCTFLI